MLGQEISVRASKGTLSSTIVGSGHLQNPEAQNIQVPTGLSIKKVAVEAGDTVSAGDALALVDETALTAEIAQIQSTIAQLDGQLGEKAGETDPQTVASKVEGRVKAVYAGAGDAVADVMVSDGALLLLSLDGKMAVRIRDTADIETTAGNTVSVTLSSGTTVTGTVESCTDTAVTVTLTDEGTVLGDTVTVSDSSGQMWGTDTLYVHQPLEITGTSGQIAAVYVTEGQWVEADEELFTLTDVPVSAEYQELLAVRTVYKEKLRELLALADSCAVTAPVDGVIESVGLTEGSTTAASGQKTIGRMYTVKLSTTLDTGIPQYGEELPSKEAAISGNQDSSPGQPDDDGGDAQSSQDGGETEGQQEQVTGFTIAAQDHMILSVDIDELDILSVEEGQEVQITMDAAENKIFSGEVTEVSDSTSGSDGSAKYTVEITVPKDGLMRVGMSASATIVTEKKEDVVVIPADAVQERGREIFVYTQYDPQNGSFSGKKEVQTGMSDGQSVEIASGLAEGETVYYEKIESPPSEEESRSGQMNGMPNLDMNGGGRPGEGFGGGGMREGFPPDGAPSMPGGQ